MNGPVQRIAIVDLRIPFLRLVWFFVKATLAAIPAAIILFMLTAIAASLIGGGYFEMLIHRGTTF